MPERGQEWISQACSSFPASKRLCTASKRDWTIRILPADAEKNVPLEGIRIAPSPSGRK